MQWRRYTERKEVVNTAKNISQVNVSEPENGDNFMPKHLKLKAAIVNTGMNQKEFAELVKVNETHLSAIVNGKKPKLLEQAQRIAKAVGMTVEELWPLEE